MTTAPTTAGYTVDQVTGHIWDLIGAYMKADRAHSDDFSQHRDALQAALTELAEAAQAAPVVFSNNGEEPDYSDLDCPYCHGSGHKGDIAAPAQGEEAKAVAVCSIISKNGGHFLALTDAGRELPPGSHMFYAAPVAQPQPPAADPGNPLGKSNSSFDSAEPDSDGAPKSPTHGMTLAERIEHVGGRTNDAGYIEFGSVMAVLALIRQVLRDQPSLALLPAEPDKSKDASEAMLRALSELENRLSLIYRLCCGTAPKQAVGELVAAMQHMDEWKIVRDWIAALQAAATKEGVQP